MRRLVEETFVIEMKGITKKFGNFVANNQIDLTLKKGEIHALLGENGAGKSTLMNILSGLLEPTEGEIKVNGVPTKIDSPNTANRLKIGMVHQHFMLVKKFSVVENIILGKEQTKFGFIDKNAVKQEIMELSKKYHLAVDPDAKVEDITVGMEQRVEILKTLYRGADILIFDEPTAVLTPQEIDELIVIMKQLTKEGKSIFLITHKIKEIQAVADRCTVIRRGNVIGTVEIGNVTDQELADMMVGRSVSFKTEKAPSNPTTDALVIKDLVVKDSRGIEAVKGLDLTVRHGEVVGIAGVDGNGQSELIQALSGLRAIESGSIQLDGKDITKLPTRQRTEGGLGHIPEDRHKHGLVLQMGLDENIGIQTYYKEPLSKNGFLNKKAFVDLAERLIEEFDVRTPSPTVAAGALSGGNQQKAIIAREIDRDPSLLIAAQPTRGLDVGAIEYIHKRLIDQRNKGKAVLLMSFELDEILNVADRIAVMYEGRIVDVLDTKETNEAELGLLMAGSTREQVRAKEQEAL